MCVCVCSSLCVWVRHFGCVRLICFSPLDVGGSSRINGFSMELLLVFVLSHMFVWGDWSLTSVCFFSLSLSLSLSLSFSQTHTSSSLFSFSLSLSLSLRPLFFLFTLFLFQFLALSHFPSLSFHFSSPSLFYPSLFLDPEQVSWI